MGRLISEQQLSPNLIVSSTAQRARTTAELVAETSGYAGTIRTTPQLYHAGPRTYRQVLGELSADHEIVMVVGHNPGLEELLFDLTGCAESLPTAALALVSLEIEEWQELSDRIDARLLEIWRPRELDD